MAGENLTPEMARIIGKLQDQIDELRARQTPVLVRGLSDLQDVYINVLTRADGDVVTWVEANQDWEALPASPGSSGFPITEDDGTYTYTAEVASNALSLHASTDGNADTVARIILHGDGDLDIQAGFNSNSTADMTIRGRHDIDVLANNELTIRAGNGITIDDLGSSITLSGVSTSLVATNLQLNPTAIGFFGAAVQNQWTVTGSRGGNAALASLLSKLALYGLIVDSST